MKLISKIQSGRSMVEMLGVLAVIGILSVGGIVGYIYAMNLWRENQTIDSVNQTAMGAVSGYLGTEYDEAAADTPLNLANVTSGISLADEVTVETVQGTSLMAYRPGESEIELEVENVTYSACKRLLSRPGEYSTASTPDRGIWVLSDDSEEDKDAFCRSIDDQERTPMRPGDRVNPNANMILCYSLSGRGCHGIPPEVPPVACTDYKLCGQQCGMDVHVHPDKQRNPANPCQICNVSDDFNSWQTVANCCNSNAECTGECEVCNTGTHRCEVQGIETSYKVKEGACCVEKKYTQCAGEAARPDECSADVEETTITDNGCSTTERTMNLCTGAVVGTTETPKSSSTVCGTNRSCQSGNCVCDEGYVLKTGTTDVCVECNFNSDCPSTKPVCGSDNNCYPSSTNCWDYWITTAGRYTVVFNYVRASHRTCACGYQVVLPNGDRPFVTGTTASITNTFPAGTHIYGSCGGTGCSSSCNITRID